MLGTPLRPALPEPIEAREWRPSDECLARLEELRQAQVAGVIAVLTHPEHYLVD